MTRFLLAILLASAAGSAFFAVPYFDLDSSYTGATAGIISLSAISALLLMVIRRPRDKSSGNTETAGQVATQTIPTENPEPVSRQQPITRPITENVTRPVPESHLNQPDLIRERPPSTETHAPARPRGYMGDQPGLQVSNDYMRKRLTQPDETLPPKDDYAPQLASIGDVNAASETTSRAAEQRQSTGKFIPFDEYLEPEQVALSDQLEPPSFQESVSRGTGSVAHEVRSPSPDSLVVDPLTTPTESNVPEVHSSSPESAMRQTETTQSEIAPQPPPNTPDEITTDIENPGQSLQRRLPTALDYYRREGVSSAVWAGVATSVVVSAVLWQLTRNGRS